MTFHIVHDHKNAQYFGFVVPLSSDFPRILALKKSFYYYYCFFNGKTTIPVRVSRFLDLGFTRITALGIIKPQCIICGEISDSGLMLQPTQWSTPSNKLHLLPILWPGGS